jgi:large subunit ribosomal protein L13
MNIAILENSATKKYRFGGRMKTYSVKPDEIERKWYLVDAQGKVLGRLATEIASILRGKKKPIFSPHMDTGDIVVVINAEKIVVTGKKREQKLYHHHSGYPGGMRSRTFADLQEQKPEQIVRLAVKGMLPHNRLGRQMIKKLRVYAGSDHPHTAQSPEPIELT